MRPPTAPVTEPLPPGTPDDIQPPAEPIEERDSVPVPTPPHQDAASLLPKIPENKLIRRAALSSSLTAGIVAAIGTSIPVIPIAMLCMFAAGGLAVTLYRRRASFQRVTAWMGIKLGLMAGGLGFGVLAILSSLRLLARSERTQLRSALRDKMQEAISTASDADVRQAIDQFRGYIETDHGLLIVVLFFLAIAAVFFLVFSALGGALGALLFGREGAHREQV